MGLFDKFVGKRELALTPRSALALAAISMIAADGSVENEELSDLAKIMRGDEAAFQAGLETYKTRSREEAIELVAKTLNQEQRLSTIAVLLDLAMADGRLAGAEQGVALAYIKAFGLSDETVKPIIDVIALKNDPSKFEG